MNHKFRAWDESQRYMAYQGTPDLESLQSFIFHFGDRPLMLFTGLYDKNGNEIFDGDILKCESVLTRIIDMSIVPNSEHINYYLVEWNSEKQKNCWQLTTIKTTRHENFGLNNKTTSFLHTITDKSEIIGNKYENPELL